jgi:hypothetical protein
MSLTRPLMLYTDRTERVEEGEIEHEVFDQMWESNVRIKSNYYILRFLSPVKAISFRFVLLRISARPLRAGCTPANYICLSCYALTKLEKALGAHRWMIAEIVM